MFCTFEKKYFKVCIDSLDNMGEKKKRFKKNTDESHNKKLKLLAVKPACIYEGGLGVQTLKPPH